MAANLLVKVDYQGDLRRFQATLPLTLSQLTETLKGVFSLPEAVSLRLAYTDSDGDKITVTSDEDLHEAIAYLPATATPSCLRLTLQDILTPSAAPASSSSLLPSAQAPAAAPTSFAFCDVCSKQIPVTQTRFKCGDCANFDLCASCEQNDAHDASHVLLKLKPAAQLRCGRLPTDKAVLPKWSSHHPAASHTQPAPSAEADFTSMLDSALREVRAAAHQPSPSPSPSPSPAVPQVDPMQSLVTSAAQLASTLFAQPPASGAAPQPAAGPQPGAGAGLAPLVSLASSLLASPAAQGAGRNLDLGSLLGSFLQAQPGSGAAPSPAGGAGAGPNFSALLSGLAAAAAAQPSPVDSQTLQPAADPAAEINDDNPASIRNILLDRGVPEQAVDDLIVASGGSLEEALEIWALQELAD